MHSWVGLDRCMLAPLDRPLPLWLLQAGSAPDVSQLYWRLQMPKFPVGLSVLCSRKTKCRGIGDLQLFLL